MYFSVCLHKSVQRSKLKVSLPRIQQDSYLRSYICQLAICTNANAHQLCFRSSFTKLRTGGSKNRLENPYNYGRKNHFPFRRKKTVTVLLTNFALSHAEPDTIMVLYKPYLTTPLCICFITPERKVISS